MSDESPLESTELYIETEPSEHRTESIDVILQRRMQALLERKTESEVDDE